MKEVKIDATIATKCMLKHTAECAISVQTYRIITKAGILLPYGQAQGISQKIVWCQNKMT